MQPSVPFPLVGSVQLLAIAAAVGLAVAALLPPVRRRTSPLVTLGGLAVAVVETLVALRLGDTTSDPLAYARAGGYVAIAAGLVVRAPRLPAAMPGIAVPLAAAPAAVAAGVAAPLLAALAALRTRAPYARWLAAGFVAAAAAAGVARWAEPGRDDADVAATAATALRGLSALLVLAGLTLLARRSVVTKVVAAIVAGVLLMAIGAVSVVGSVVLSSYQRQEARQARDVAAGRVAAIEEIGAAAIGLAQVVAACNQPAACTELLRVTATQADDFAVRVDAAGRVAQYGGVRELSRAEQLAVAGNDVVREVATSPRRGVADRATTVVRLLDGSVGVLGVVAVRPARVPEGRPEAVAAYGVALGAEFARNSRAATGGFDVSVLVESDIVASSLPDRRRAELADLVAATDIGTGTTLVASGDAPTVHVRPLENAAGERVALLAVSRPAEVALRTQRDALRTLLVVALVVATLVAVAAVVTGRRLLVPLRRLTLAAARVQSGDLRASAGVTSADEVGTLSRTFDRMTSSLAELNAGLRVAAQQEATLRARLETVLESMGDGLVVVDARGSVTSVNPAALRLLGADAAAAVVGRPLAEAVPVTGPTGGRAVVPESGDAVASLARRGADPVPVAVSVAPLRGADAGRVIVLRDLTREREVERMKTEFLSNVSHELRTPLTPILGYADLLLSRPDLPRQKVHDFVSTIRSESARMARVVELLVDVAAIEAGRVEVAPVPTDVRHFLDERLAAWRERAPDRADDLRRRVATGLPSALLDRTWIAKAYDELVDNAVKYTEPGTPITLAAALSDDGRRVRISVRDTGPGIPAEARDRLFLRFEQVDGSATRSVGGLGLGLAFVRRLADDISVPVVVHSTEGKGSEFGLELPADSGPPPRPRRAVRSRRERVRSR